MRQRDLKAIANFIYEAGVLSKTPRSGLWFLGSGDQSVAEHILRSTFIGYVLCFLTPKADCNKVVRMCLLHDFGEARTSDLNYVHQKYGRLAEARAIEELAKNVPFGDEIRRLFQEVSAKKTLEARLVGDADQLEWIATLREEQVKGNTKANTWARIAHKRLKTLAGKRIGKLLLTTHPDTWWFNTKDKWFIDRKEKYRKWGR